MRLSLATAACVVSVALLAGCSNSPTGSSMPSTPTQTGAARQGGVSAFAMPPQHMTRDQAAKWHPSVLPKSLAAKFAGKHFARPHIRAAGGSVTGFVMDDAGYIWELHKKKVVGYHNDCSGAEGGVVDHSGRLVVACTNTGTVNIYNAGNNNGSADVVLDEDTSTSFAYPAAAFEDTAGNIYVTNLYGESNCNPYCTFDDGYVAWWTTSNQASGATPSGQYTDPNTDEGFFGDVDASGNVYMDMENLSFTPEVDEISNIMTAPSSTNLNISLEFPGGVYVVSPSSGSPELSIIDQGTYGSGADALYLYSLPGMSLLYTDKPKQNLENLCDPVAGGYSSSEADISIGDAGCHSNDVGVVATNKWKDEANIDFDVPIDGAYATSDK